jgi:hypothetical protein
VDDVGDEAEAKGGGVGEVSQDNRDDEWLTRLFTTNSGAYCSCPNDWKPRSNSGSGLYSKLLLPRSSSHAKSGVALSWSQVVLKTE